MIARVGLDAQALLDYQSDDPRDMNVHHDVVEFMQEYGILQLRGEQDKMAILEAIRAQESPSVRTLWEKYMQAYRQYGRIRSEELSGTTHDSLLAPVLHSAQAQLDLVLVGEELKGALEVSSPQGWVDSAAEQPELAIAYQVNRTKTKARLGQLREVNYPLGASRDVIWDEVFQKPVSISGSAHLLDRYFLKGDGYGWFIAKLEQNLEPGSELTLLGELPKEVQEDALESQIRERLPTLKNLSRIRVVLSASWDKEKRTGKGRRSDRTPYGPHNRHLRLPCGVNIGVEE